jgi:MoaA/NifB/PqqE/SkfB family radical SAM enzyme
VARAIAREKPEAVMISGGEPALAKGIDEVAAFLRASGIALSMFTSGWGLDEARIQRLTAAFDRIHVSIDSANPETNDRIRGKIGAHQNASNTLRLLSERASANPRARFGVDCMVVQSNLAGVRDYCAFAAGFAGLKFINISPAVPTGRASQEEFSLLLSDEQVASLLGQTQAIRDSLPRSIALSIHKNDFLKSDDEHCIQLNANGDVRAIKICEKTVGNLVEEPLDDILKRAASWRSQSSLAQSLTTVSDFVAWGDIVRRIDTDNATAKAKAHRGVAS